MFSVNGLRAILREAGNPDDFGKVSLSVEIKTDGGEALAIVLPAF